MREIKFRVYTEIENEVLGMKYFGLSDTSERNDTIMQFTGLLDKNGKEIYEGDIVNIGGRDGVFEIKISNRSGVGFWRGNWELGDDNDISDPIYIEWGRIEIIGNIYQNPELLK